MDEKKIFVEKINESLTDNSFVKIIIGKYRGDDKEFQNIFVNKIEIKDEEKLSFKFRYRTKDVVKNYDFEKGVSLIEEIIGKDFFSATLFTTSNDYTIDYSKKRIPLFHTKKPVFTASEQTSHNKIKSRFVNEDAKYFLQLGITTTEGKVKSDKFDKFRQVDKFIEIVDSLYRSSSLKEKEEIKIMDMGSGKSYMTFAMYDYFSNTLNKKVLLTGVEEREDLVNLSNKIAEECGYSGLKFMNASIKNLNDENADIIVALHACDTATDDAIEKAIHSKAEIIILAPCCHKYVRKKIKSPELMKGIYKHGILEERLAVSITDGLRALTLEYFGYTTKVFEFISTEHTAKNTMITAVKNDSKKNNDKIKEIKSIKDEFGIDDFYLDRKIFP